MRKLVRFMLPLLACLTFSSWAQAPDDKKLPDYKTVQLQQFPTLQPFTLANLNSG